MFFFFFEKKIVAAEAAATPPRRSKTLLPKSLQQPQLPEDHGEVEKKLRGILAKPWAQVSFETCWAIVGLLSMIGLLLILTEFLFAA